MTRRAVVFMDQDGTRYITEEFNGDKVEFETFFPDSCDKCTRDWREIAQLFNACACLDDFVNANKEAWGYYVSGLSGQCFEPIRRLDPGEMIPIEGEVMFVIHPACRIPAQGELDRLVARQIEYIRQVGGILTIKEADDTYNDFNRQIIAAFYRVHGAAYLCKARYYDFQRERIISGAESVYTEYIGQPLETFCCTFCVPTRDRPLQTLLRIFNESEMLSTYRAITDRVKEVGGVQFLWF